MVLDGDLFVLGDDKVDVIAGSGFLLFMVALSVFVVPAKAGTHNHRWLGSKESRQPVFETITAAAYGSRPSPGRHRLQLLLQRLKLVVLRPGSSQHRRRRRCAGEPPPCGRLRGRPERRSCRLAQLIGDLLFRGTDFVRGLGRGLCEDVLENLLLVVVQLRPDVGADDRQQRLRDVSVRMMWLCTS